jgi:perosamine synthetase
MIKAWSAFMPEKAKEEVLKVMDSLWLNTGYKEKEFREKLKTMFNAKYAVACNSGTTALKAALFAAGIKRGDEVVTTPYTFIATNTSILEMGAIPVFADIDYETLNITAEEIEKKITKKTKAIMVVHYGGLPAKMEDIWNLGNDYDIPVIEDSAHALGSKYQGQIIGSRGDMATFSLQVVKIITCGDGGAILTSNEEYNEKLKRAVWYGIDREKRDIDSIDPLPEDITELGFKGNMNDITAAMASASMDYLNTQLKKRMAIASLYLYYLSKLNNISVLRIDKEMLPNYQIFPIHVKERIANKDREKFRSFMYDRNIEVVVNNRRNDKYTIFGGLRKELVNTRKADEDTILIPCHSNLSINDVFYIIENIYEYDKP